MRNALLPLLILGGLGAVADTPLRAADQDPKLAQQAYTILEKACYRCHGQNGAVDVATVKVQREIGVPRGSVSVRYAR